MLNIQQLYDLNHTLAGNYLAGFEYPWQALGGIKNLILNLGPTLGEDYQETAPTVWVHKTAPWLPPLFWVPPVSSAPIRRFVIVPISAAALWWVKTVW